MTDFHTGERLFTPREFAEIAEHRAVAYVQPDLAHCGGLTGGRKIAAIAEAAHMGVAPHNPMGPVAGAVALHFDLATPNFLIQEEAVGLVPWFRDICTEVYPLDMENGVWGVPEAPGLGIEIDETAAACHPFKQEEIPALEASCPMVASPTGRAGSKAIGPKFARPRMGFVRLASVLKHGEGGTPISHRPGAWKKAS